MAYRKIKVDRARSPGADGAGRVVLPVCTSGHTKERPMLVLSRKKNESIVIDNDITIVVVEIRGDKVRLGVEAPKEVPVHRREVFDAIRRNELASGNDAAGRTDSGTSSQG